MCGLNHTDGTFYVMQSTCMLEKRFEAVEEVFGCYRYMWIKYCKTLIFGSYLTLPILSRKKKSTKI